MNDSLVSVIIVNWNGASYLPTCLAALRRQTYTPIEVVIVDNASTDQSCQILDEGSTRVSRVCRSRFSGEILPEGGTTSGRVPGVDHHFETPGMKAICRGNNQGIQASHGDFVLLLNADVTLEPEFIQRLVEVMHSDPEVGIALGKLLSGHDPTIFDSTGIVMLKNRRAIDRGQREQDRGQYNRQEEVFGASGAAGLYRKTMFWSRSNISMMNIWMNCFLRIKKMLIFHGEPDSEVGNASTPRRAVGTHFRTWGAGKRADIPKWIRRHSLKNRYLMLLKNECWTTLRPSLFSILWYEIRSCLYILFWEPYLWIIIGDILHAWPEILEKRRKTHQAVTITARRKLRTWFRT